MSAIAARRRRRTAVMLAVTMVVALAVPLLTFVGVRAVLDSTGGYDARADNLPTQSFPATPTALLLTTDIFGELSSATVFVLHPSLVGGSAIPLAVNADTGFSSDARQSLQQTFADGGADAVVLAVESLTLVTINHVDVADEAAVVGLLSPFAPLTVELVADVSTSSPESPEALPIPAGTAVLTAESAAKILTESAASSPGGQAGHRGNAEALWRAVSTAVGAGRPPATAAGVPVDVDQFMSAVFAGPMPSRGLATRSLDGAENPSGLDVVDVRKSDVVLVFASIAPGSMSAPAPGPSLRLEAPSGYDAKLEVLIGLLLFLDVNVVSIDTTVPPRSDTVFLVPDDVYRADAQRTGEIFGSIVFEEPTVRWDLVDLTIVVGTDFLDRFTA